MLTEKEKMLAGQLYDPLDKTLSQLRLKARRLLHAFNYSSPEDASKRQEMLRKLVPHAGESLWIEPPFYCDYGEHIHTGDQVFFNFNCVVLDAASVTIGRRTLMGPNVQIYTALHPIDHRARGNGLEFSAPVTIGEDVWIGGGAIICPGTTIGNRSVIGAGSVVTRNIPEDVFAAGNPCRVIRALGL